jgi:hypothetical protein
MVVLNSGGIGSGGMGEVCLVQHIQRLLRRVDDQATREHRSVFG